MKHDDEPGLWELLEDFRTAAEGTPFVKMVDAQIREIVVDACMEDDALYARFIALGEARKSETASPAGALTAEKAPSGYGVEAVVARAMLLKSGGRANDWTTGIGASNKDEWLSLAVAAIAAFQKATGGDPRGEATASPSSARERREIIEECAKVADRIASYCTRDSTKGVAVLIAQAIRFPSDGRGREKGNTSNSDDGIDPAPPATESTKS